MFPRPLKVTFFIFIFTILLVAKGVFAEMELGLVDTDVSVTTFPENPQPYQDVTVKLASYSTDLNLAMITWKKGSQTVLGGYGKTKYTFTAPGPNSSTAIDITIIPSGSTDTVTKKIVISPADMEILWEAADGYTPPFYKGKSFISQEGAVKVVAIPNTNTIKAGKGNMSYTWKNRDKTVQNASGYNKDSYVFNNSELNDSEKVTVQATSVDGNYNAKKTITIPITQPLILFYKKSPTEGVLYNRALGSETTMTEDEMTVVAEPYFLAIKGNESDFTYSWKINGDDIDTPAKKMELTVRPSSRGGYATIDLVLENLNTLYQKVAGRLKINL